jgi:hypothetical protein
VEWFHDNGKPRKRENYIDGELVGTPEEFDEFGGTLIPD